MGSPDAEGGEGNEHPQQPVTISRDFFMGTTLITNQQYVTVMGPSERRMRDGEENRPAHEVTWFEGEEFCRLLSEKTGRSFRLPTEAEWEYACRAGTTTAFYTGDTITTDQANFDGKEATRFNPAGDYLGKNVDVAQYPPNPWGLYDMHGNQAQYCLDNVGRKYSIEPITDPMGPPGRGAKVLRGGQSKSKAEFIRSAARYGYAPGVGFGLRIVMEAEAGEMRFHHRLLLLATMLFGSMTALGDSLPARPITVGPQHHFFGYIGHVQNTPWSGDGRYLVALRTDYQDHMPEAADRADVVLLDGQNDYAVTKIATTGAWNFQQGTMFYWNPSAPNRELFFNDRDPKTNRVFTVLFDIETGKRIREYRFEDTPFANGGVAQVGGFFLGLNYGRLARLRPVTGYPEAFDWTVGVLHPQDDGLFKVDIATGEKSLLVSFEQLATAIQPTRPDLEEKALFINHTLNNRDGDRIYFYVRGDFEDRKNRLDVPFTINTDGTGLTMHPLHIGGHPEWAEGHRLIGKHDNQQILYDTDRQAVVNVLGDRTIFANPGGDVALSPDGTWLANGYRHGKTNRYVFLNRKTGGVLRAGPFPTDHWTSGALRIDAAPCWNRTGTQIAFPAIADDEKRTRQLFLLDIAK